MSAPAAGPASNRLSGLASSVGMPLTVSRRTR